MTGSASPRKPRPLCVNCRTRTAWRPRRLCYACYDDPEVRARTPPLAVPCNRRGTGREEAEPDPELVAEAARTPFAPTLAAPGTFGKIEEMARRALFHRPLFHRNDYASMHFTSPLSIGQMLLPNGAVKGDAPRRRSDGNPDRCVRCGKKKLDGETHKVCQACRVKMAASYRARADRGRIAGPDLG